jgi:hypothetical protein
MAMEVPDPKGVIDLHKMQIRLQSLYIQINELATDDWGENIALYCHETTCGELPVFGM